MGGRVEFAEADVVAEVNLVVEAHDTAENYVARFVPR